MKIKNPPLASNGLQLYKTEHRCKHIIKNSLGYIVCFANDFSTQNNGLITSTCFGTGNGLSVLKKTFVECCMIYTIRTIPNIKWYNNQFPYYEPKIKKD